jgi:hypothetical protein
MNVNLVRELSARAAVASELTQPETPQRPAGKESCGRAYVADAITENRKAFRALRIGPVLGTLRTCRAELAGKLLKGDCGRSSASDEAN